MKAAFATATVQFVVIDEQNRFEVKGFKRKNNGGGVLKVKVPGKGKFTVTGGKKIRKVTASSNGARTLKPKIKPKGKFKRKLARKAAANRNASANVKLKLSFQTPLLPVTNAKKKVKLVRK